MDQANLNGENSRKDVQDRRLDNMPRLGRNCDDAKEVLNNAKISVESIEMGLSSFGTITVDDWVLYGKKW